jgi:MFS family permease
MAGASFTGWTQRGWLLTGIAVSGVTTFAMGLTNSLPFFFLLRFCGGIASAFVLVYSSALILEHMSHANRPDLTAVFFSGVGVGIMLSTVIVYLLDRSGISWSGHWICSGVISLLALPLVARLIPPAAESHREIREGHGPVNTILGYLILSYGLFGFGYVITATFLVVIVRSSATAESLEPLIWLLVGASAAASFALCNWLANHFGILRAYAIACLFEAAGVSCSVLWQSLSGLVLAAVLLGGTFVGISGLALIAARLLSHGRAHRALALMTAIFGVGQIAGPVFAGYLKDLTGSFLLPSLAASVALVVAALLVINKPVH